MTQLLGEHVPPAASGPAAPNHGPERGFLDCRGHWHRLDEPDDPEVVSGEGRS